MPHFLDQKNVLIVPLSLFIQFNKKMAGEQFANLFGKFFDDMFSCDEEIQEHEKFCEKLLHKILTSQLVAEFNLGKKTKHEFTKELSSFLALSDKSNEIETAWNSLIQFNRESSAVFDALINLTRQAKSIYFIGNTNELHAKKILDLFTDYSCGGSILQFIKSLPDKIQALPVAITETSSELTRQVLPSPIGTVYFYFSHTYKTLLEQPQGNLTKLFAPFKLPSGLLTHLKVYLNDIGKTKDDILLINPYKKNQSITKKLALETISNEQFFTDLLTLPTDTATNAMLDFKLVEVHPKPPNLSTDDYLAALQATECRPHLSSSP